ncbi:hypothetical protein Kpol_1050p21 [Vanderwaltozyma polyspora DSM 70294]|uniref:t-SNARE coiled-coil homology domain-containing protein n=1 Tax=Vanderwaltozyma polyspora (strain ATCC 22028 / DSM 70294 / BCRC 21397 / CBS 2163 / NBRC 10782 / NRRL Y-8283 / UCD 57-17) TaxID=436907 RepID=A7TER8_VANPO|nr:uncharacterized protein Kpol_1050p21 [Vanderwaltozyma polyspora DSM 70294]EDO19164.1 hypothetical protein Kpol_1050p21 [Vanderwaltozyma polyspora DSM 70294]
MRSNMVKVEVNIEDVKIVNSKYASYGILIILKSVDGSIQYYDKKVYRRYSEFFKLKKNLEREFGVEIPYEFPDRLFVIWVGSNIDPDVIESRRKKLSKFLYDLLNDSFDSKWKNSDYVSEFLDLRNDWDSYYTSNGSNVEQKLTGKNNSVAAAVESLDLKDSMNWEIFYRNCKDELQMCKRNKNKGINITKDLMQLRLKLIELENPLDTYDRSTVDVDKNKNLLKLLKDEVNELSITAPSSISELRNTSGNGSNSNNNSEDSLRKSLFPQTTKPYKKPSVGRRKLGETEETIKMNNQQLLQKHKDVMLGQDEELHQLKQVVQRQRNISIELNEELSYQNELLDLMDNDISGTGHKLRRANNQVRQINNDS